MNLKPRNMRGVKSNGMLLAASNADHTEVQLLSPPEGSVPGERIKFGSLDAKQQQPWTANRVQKKKVWEELQPNLNTSNKCVVCYNNLDMLTSVGTVTVESLSGASV